MSITKHTTSLSQYLRTKSLLGQANVLKLGSKFIKVV